MITDFSFLTSRRFWALVVVAILGVLDVEGIVSGEVAKALEIILYGFIGVRTIDRFGENVAK